MTIKEIEKCQSVIKEQIKKSLKKNEIERALKQIDTYADFNHRVNNILRDDEIESYLKAIASSFSDYQYRKDLDKNTVIFYDQIGTSICLGLQYIRGLIKNNYKVIYIYEGWNHKIDEAFLDEIKTYNIEYYIYDSRYQYYKNGVYIGDEIRNCILNTNAAKLILHPDAPGALGATILYSLHDVEIFRIVPGDHHFFVGYDFVKQFIHFRSFGIMTSIIDRNISVSRNSLLPFYPIIKNNYEFAGFPKQADGKIVVLTAGAEYKYLGSNLFYDQCLRILSYPNVIILYCGKIFPELSKFIKINNLYDKLIPIGYRRDFIECIKHCDIYLNSYPFPGGLVCQTAAYYNKAIIAFAKKEEYLMYNMDELLNSPNENKMTAHNLDSLYNHIDSLILDQSYRSTYGERLGEVLQTENNFNKGLKEIIEGNGKYKIEVDKITLPVNRHLMVDWYIYSQNKYQPTVLVPLFVQYGFKAFLLFNCLFLDIIKNPFFSLKFLLLHVYKLIK